MTTTPEFTEFPKMARLSRPCLITEKIDGTNAQVFITPGPRDTPGAITGWFDEETATDMLMFAGSRTRWITPSEDNYGFAGWVFEHAEELKQLGAGRHFGEWWGQGIQRKYGMNEKRWSLFNVARWCLHDGTPEIIPTADPRIVKTQELLPACCHLVPVLYRGMFDTCTVEAALQELRDCGSKAAPGFMRPEGVVCFHVAGNFGLKKTLEKDETPKGLV
jgi:hypothetical protein